MIGEPDDIEQLNALFGQLAGQYNQQAQPDFGGLSPDQVQRLLYRPWNEPGSALRLNTDMPAEAFGGAQLIEDVLLLGRVIDSGHCKATKLGNLPRKAVLAMVDAMELSERDTLLLKSRRAVNEEDVQRVHAARILAELAGLIHRRSGSWRLVKKRQVLFRPEHRAGLYMALFLTFLRKFNLAYLDGLPEAPEVQQTLGYSLARLRDHNDWTDWNLDTARALLLPAVRDELEGAPRESWQKDWVQSYVDLRILRPLDWLGLVERRLEGGPFEETTAFRTTPLFEQVLVFDLGRRNEGA